MNEFQSPTQSPSKVAIEINCAIEGDLLELFLVFSVDEISWYQVPMHKTPNNYTISIPNISVGAKILYLFKAIGPNGEEFVENNNGQFYSQIAGSDLIDHTDQTNELMEEVVDSRQRIAPSEQLPAIQLKSEKKDLSHSLPPEFSTQPFPVNPFLQDSEQAPFEESTFASNSRGGGINDSETQKISVSNKGSRLYIRPIIAYNPFPADYGDIQATSSPIQSFSNIIGAQLTTLPEKKRSFIKRPEVLEHQPCSHCQAILSSKWKICPICGNKA